MSYCYLCRICAQFVLPRRARKIFYFSSSFIILKRKSFGISSQGSTSFFDTKDSDTDIILLYSFVGRLFVKALGKPSDILTKLNEMAGFSPNEEIELYEVSAIFSYVQLCFYFSCSPRAL